MSEPERWLTQPRALSALERELLERAKGITPPAGSKQQIWSALAASLPSPVHASGDAGSGVRLKPAASAGHGASASSALGAGAAKTQALIAVSAIKALAVGFALGAASVGTLTWLVPNESTSTPSAPTPSAIASERAPVDAPVVARAVPKAEVEVPSLAVSASRPRQTPRVEAEGPAEPGSEPAARNVEPSAARAAFPDATPAPAAAPAPTGSAPNLLDRARLESRRVAEARGRLRAGDARGALGLLAAVAGEFPSGVLVQEREALTIEALLACGERQAASERALDFLRRYPGSPHTLSVQRALQ
jgi:hypothetical protein